MEEKNLPKLREEILFQTFEEDGKEYIVLYDPQGYALQQVIFPIETVYLLKVLEEGITEEELRRRVKEESGDENYDVQPILEIVEYLNFLGYLDSPHFNEIKKDIDDFRQSSVRPPICVNSSYPSDPNEIISYFDKYFSDVRKSNATPKSNSLILPHLDLKLEEAITTYAEGFKYLDYEDIDLAVIFGTSHYANSGFFMLTEKDYETPLGLVKTNKEIISKLKEILKNEEFIIDDMAHRFEHSIEFQIILLQYLIGHNNFTVLPILTGSLTSFFILNKFPNEDYVISSFTKNLNNIINNTSKKPIFIASADLAHIGRKFGDKFDAETQLEQLQKEDLEMIRFIEAGSSNGFYEYIKSKNDNRKVCGLSPIYFLMETVKPSYSKLIKYNYWNEKETKSAVSIASIALYK